MLTDAPRYLSQPTGTGGIGIRHGMLAADKQVFAVVGDGEGEGGGGHVTSDVKTLVLSTM